MRTRSYGAQDNGTWRYPPIEEDATYRLRQVDQMAEWLTNLSTIYSVRDSLQVLREVRREYAYRAKRQGLID